MKRVFTLLFIVISVICSASAQLAQLDDGYYRIQCVETGRYISFRNNYVDEESFLRTTESQFWSLRTISGFENVVNDPGSVIYLKKHEQGWTLCSQDYDFDFFGSFFQITDMGDGTYRLWATYSESESGITRTRYMRDCDDASGGFSYVTTEAAISKGWNWRLIPVSSADQAYLGLVPEVKVGGKGYTTFYASIPVRLNSGMKAYVVDSKTETTFTPKYIGDEVPANTPVIIECAGDNASDNKLTPLESSSVSASTNCLSGVMFCYPVFMTYQGQVTEIRENPYWNTVDYDNSTMRLLAAQDGKLVFKTAGEELDYMPANKAYLNVTSSSAATLSSTGTTFTAKTTENIDMVFTILDESAKTCQVGYLDGSLDKTAVDKEIVEGPVTIPGTVEGYTVVKIGKWALNNVDGMTSITIPNTVTSIDDYAFSSCEGLTSFELPASVTSLGTGALSAFWNVTSLKVAAGNTTFDSRDNCNAIIEKATNKIVAGCQTTIIPANATGIGTWAFSLSRGSIFIPSTITTIEENAFSCRNVTIQVERTTPLVINGNVFQGLSNSTLRVPAGCKSAYAAATGWKNFGTILEGNEGSTFTAKTTEGIDMVFTILDESAKTCQVGYLDGSWDKTAVDKNTVNGAVTIPNTANGYTVVKIGRCALQGVNGMKTVTIPNTVTSIDEYAFANCQGLTSFVLPKNVTYVGRYALSPLRNVTSVKVEEGNTKYDSRDNCNAIIETATNILQFGYGISTIPASVKELGVDAFFNLYDCTLTIPSTITKINEYAFSGCQYLNLQVAHTDPLVINGNVFQGLSNSTLRVPAGCKSAYAEATGWKNFGTILEGNEGSTFTAKTTEGIDMVFTILDESAKTCQVGYLDGSWDKIAVDRETVSGSVTIPEKANNYTVVKIGKWALTGINGMTSVTIPNTVTSIDEFAFRYCGLTSFELPANVTYVGRYALSALRNVTSVKVAEGNPNYDSRDNCNAIIETATNILQFGYGISTIPASVKELGIDAFYNLYDYTLTIPSTITKIGDYAFEGNGNLSLQVEHTTPLEINENVFNHLSNSTLRVPAGCKSAYAEATGWSKFGTDNIVEEKKISINVETAGTLSSKISDEDKFNITDLTITGRLNGTDFRLLRAMAGNNYKGQSTEGKLQKLDLSGATIVEGGDTYFESDRIYRDGFIVEVLGSQSHSTGNNVVGPFLFAGCTQLSEVKIPASTTEIGPMAFMMTNISALDIPEGVKKVWASFSYNTRVSTITIPSSVMEIGDSWGTYPYLSSIVVASDNSKYDSRNNCNAIMEKSTNTLVLGCKNTIIPDDTKIIGSYAFSGDIAESITLPQGLQAIKNCAFNSSSIKSIAIPASVSLIEDLAFGYCNNLATITVDASNETYESPEGSNAIIEKSTKTLIAGCKSTIIPPGVKKISGYLFHNWYSLTSITIPASIEAIGDCAFDYCNNLTSVTVEAVEPLAINETVFSGTNTNATLYVPAGSKAKYKAATGWKDFKEIIETISVFSGTNLWAGYVAVENFALPTGLKAYVITSLDATTATASPLDYIPQGVPVLLKRENTSDNNFEMSAGSGTAPTVNLLRTYESAKNVSNREGFILYNDEFVLVNEGTLPAGRVFLPANKSGVALTRGIVTGGDDTTGIYNSKMDFDDSDKQWYDLQGRKLERKPTKKGIYILDGRKVVIK